MCDLAKKLEQKLATCSSGRPPYQETKEYSMLNNNKLGRDYRNHKDREPTTRYRADGTSVAGRTAAQPGFESCHAVVAKRNVSSTVL